MRSWPKLARAGQVYRARDTRLKREVALELLADSFAGDHDRMARLQREAELPAALNHPDIAHVYGLEGRALVMEFVKGTMLTGFCLEASGKDGSEELRREIELGHDHFVPFLHLGLINSSQGRIAEGLAAAERAYSLAPWSSQAIGLLAGVLVRSGDRGRAQGLLDKLGSSQAYGAPLGLAIFHLLCSDIDRAADRVEKVIEERHPSVVIFLSQPYARPLRSSGHWPKLAKLMKLPPEAL